MRKCKCIQCLIISQQLILYHIHEEKCDANSGPIGTFLNYKCVMMKPSPWGSLGCRWILKFCPFFHNGCQYWASSIRSSYFGIFSMWNHLGFTISSEGDGEPLKSNDSKTWIIPLLLAFSPSTEMQISETWQNLWWLGNPGQMAQIFQIAQVT